MTAIQSFLDSAWKFLSQPELLAQFAIIAGCIVVGGLFAHGLHRYRQRRARQQPQAAESRGLHAARIGLDGFARVVTPLCIASLLWIAHLIAKRWYPINWIHIASVLFGAMVLVRLAIYVLRQTTSSPVIASFERWLALFVWLIVAFHVTGLFEQVVDALEGVRFVMGKRRSISLYDLLEGGFTVLIAVMLSLWIGTVLESRLMRLSNIDLSVRVVFTRIARALVLVTAVLLGLVAAGFDLTLLSVFGGAFGVALGLGLQKIASNYLSGFILLLDRSLKIGDIIKSENYYGTVTQIKTRYTVIQALDGTEAIIPNELLINNPVQNFSYTDRKVRVASRIQISYRSDVERALAILVSSATAHPRVLAKPEPFPYLVSFLPDGMELEVGFWIRDPEEGTLNVRSQINQTIWREFQAAGIEIPYPQREVRLIS